MAKIKSFEENHNSYDKWFEKNSLIFKDELKIAKELIAFEVNGLEIGVGSGIEPSREIRKLAQEK